ncbi:MAG: hypothetical protein JO056_04905 [Alphaproteobacteria bacterium]|nr:hypothetical protein [Alphaproteobacteria bacterium]
MTAVNKLFAIDPFWGNRGKAIDAYAGLEQSLCDLMRTAGEMPRRVAGTIFFKITNSGARNGILEKLIHQRCGSTYNPFWNCYFRQLPPMDIERNKVVHWASRTNVIIDEHHLMWVGTSLVPPTYATEITEEAVTYMGLVAFAKKCGVFAALCDMFSWVMFDKEHPWTESADAWRDIFQQPLVYPLPADHLLFRTPPKPSTADFRHWRYYT